VAGAIGGAIGYAGHKCLLRCQYFYRLAVIGHVLFDDFCVAIGKHGRAALVANLLVRTFDHAVAFSRLPGFDLTRCCHLEAFFGARLCLHLWHFAFP